MTTKLFPKFFIFINALFALTAIALTAYKAPASLIYNQSFFPKNVFYPRLNEQQPHNQATSEIIAQCRYFRRHGAGWGNGSYGRLYDVKTVETIKGKVVKVDAFIPREGMSQGVHLQVETQQGMIPVHLGPVWYIENQDIIIKPEDKVEIKGSKINFAGKPTIIAAEIKKGNMTLLLRDEDGFPLWSGWRRYQFD